MDMVMEVNGGDNVNRTTILHLPEEVVEFILSLVSPYDDLESCRCVCKKWKEHANAVARRLVQRFHRCIVEMDVTWQLQCPAPGPSIMARYSHCACRHNNSMFVFGGCTLMETAFNDLWRFDLSTRRWVRPLAVGTYPPPSASSTLVVYKDTLIVFGGWACSSPNLLYQGRRCFNLLHFYSPESNRWDRITTSTSPPPMAKHATTVHGDLMVVFGGVQLESSDRDSTSHCYGFNDVWVFDIVNSTWFMQPTTDPKPEPRFGHTQIRIDDEHALVIGGCGGPNRMFRDVWLLTITRLGERPWIWTKISIRGNEFCPPNMWNHQGCKVGQSVVFLSCGKRGKPYAKYALYTLFRVVPRAWRPPQNRNPVLASAEECVNGRKGTFAKRVKPQVARNHSSSSSGSGSNNEDEEGPDAAKQDAVQNDGAKAQPSESVFVGEVPSTSWAGNLPAHPCERGPVRNSRMPSVKPNSMRNWQQHLDGLRRMEDRIRSLKSAQPSAKGSVSKRKPTRSDGAQWRLPSPSDKSMQVYTLDVSRVVQGRVATWLPVQHCDCSCGPEETIFFSLVEGKGELILFGGVQNRNSFDETFGDRVGESEAEGRAIISNMLAFVSPKKYIV